MWPPAVYNLSFDAIQKARSWILTTQAAKRIASRIMREPIISPPAYDAEELLGIINPDIRLPMDMMEIILRIVDDSRIEQFKPSFGKGMITAWGRIHGKLHARFDVTHGGFIHKEQDT